MAEKKKKADKTGDAPGLYINRELSWLMFNERVLEEAQDKINRAFERLKFLSITSSNLDEFFMVRVSGIMELENSGVATRDPSGMSPSEQLAAISERVHGLVYKQYNCLNRSILPLLEKEGVYFPEFGELSEADKLFAKKYFDGTLYPIITPMAIDSARPFPHLSNKSLNIIIELDDPGSETFAVINVPSVVGRFIELPPQEGGRRYILIEDIIKESAEAFFPGHKTRGAYCFRITRDGDLSIDEEDAEDLLNEIERSVKKRKWGDPVRLEIERAIKPELRRFLTNTLELGESGVYEISGPIDLTFFMSFVSQKGFENLRDKTYIPRRSAAFQKAEDDGLSPFDAIREKDILVHHPYESFDCVIDFVKAAGADPQVLAIKQTLYRVSGNSPIVAALMQAAENGKQVTVLVELKARFDEENNILWAKKLEKAGCHVVYGLVGLKTHCKLCLVVRREDDGGILRYVHLGTGNYNDSTAKIYTDFGFFTCRESFGQDISALFNVLTGYSLNSEWNKISVAPKTLRESFISLIEAETRSAKEGKPALIMAKLNSLVDSDIIKKLYEASKAGVKIKLLVRGICCLKPHVAGVSDNIQVTSIVDRYLEHSRVYYFQNGENPLIYLSSADWMPRNLDRRVEVAFPIDDERLKRRITAVLDTSFADTVKLRVQRPDGEYAKLDKRGKEHIHSQTLFQERNIVQDDEA